LNIGPRPDGTIPTKEQEILLDIGKWLKINGEAIYGTRPWLLSGEGPTEVPEGSFTDTKRQSYTGQDVRFTEKGNFLYVTALAWPGQELVIHSLGKTSPLSAERIAQVSLLGGPAQLSWSQGEDGLKVHLPDQKPGEHAYVIKIERKE
jgi:alpha-L-fucosidase